MALFQSGMPLQVTQSGGQIWDGTQRPNLIGDPSTSGRRKGSASSSAYV